MKLDIFAICEGAFNSNSRLTVVNVYDYINVVSFPVKVSLGVAIKITFRPDEAGDKNILLSIINREKNQEIAKMEAQTKVPHDKDDVILNLASNVQGFSFPEPGKYDFKMYLDGVEIGVTTVHVKPQKL